MSQPLISGDFHPNRGQYHPAVSWVANVGQDLYGDYHGAGWCRVKLEGLKPVGIQYLEDFPAGDDEPQIVVERVHRPQKGEVIAMASCYELVVDAWSASGAILAAIAGEDEEDS